VAMAEYTGTSLVLGVNNSCASDVAMRAVTDKS